MTPTSEQLAAVDHMVRESPTIQLLEAVLRPLRKKTTHLERLHELDPDCALHAHAAAQLRAVLIDCIWEADRRGHHLDLPPEKWT